MGHVEFSAIHFKVKTLVFIKPLCFVRSQLPVTELNFKNQHSVSLS